MCFSCYTNRVSDPKKRVRPSTTVTLSPENAERIKLLTSKTGIPQARIIEKALDAMLPVYVKDPTALFNEPEEG